MQIRRISENLQLADDSRFGRVGEVDRVQRVGLTERDHVSHVAHEPDGVDPLALAESVDLSDLDEFVFLAFEHRHHALGLVGPPPALR